jgi:formate-dependent nitrite reductase membrane component NrfD
MTAGDGWRPAQGNQNGGRKRRRPGSGWGGGRRGGEVPMVEEADFTSYYGRPIIKQPTWKTPDVPLYLFLGGAAGSSALLGEMADVSGRPALSKAAHYTAAVEALASVGFLIHDLGRPERFLHMLRVIKPTSPLSVGSYILAPFSGLATATAAAKLLNWFPRLRRLSSALAAVFGPPMTTYTAVLLANTAVPAWHEPHREMPFVFAGSAMAAGGGITMIFTPVGEAGPARKTGVAGAALELGAMNLVETGHGIVSEPYHEGKAAALMKAAKACTASGAGLTVLAGRTRLGQAAAGVLLAAGSALTRFGVFEAGLQSARDPKYTVVPQRQRIASREGDHQVTVTR